MTKITRLTIYMHMMIYAATNQAQKMIFYLTS